MKYINTISLLSSFAILSSCKNTWVEEDKVAWQTACMDNARHWAASEAKAHTYCDCVMDKMMKKYPKESDALDQIDSLVADTSLANCRAAAVAK